MLGYILTLCISAILLLPAFEALTHEDDKRALLDLFRATNGPTRPHDKGWRLKGSQCEIARNGEQNCTVAEGWGDDSDPCDDTWYGVVNFEEKKGFKVGCTGDEGSPDRRVTGIYLSNNVLRGSLPESLGNLVELRELLLPSNGLKGKLPGSIGKLKKLESLWLHNNALSGRITREILEQPLGWRSGPCAESADDACVRRLGGAFLAGLSTRAARRILAPVPGCAPRRTLHALCMRSACTAHGSALRGGRGVCACVRMCARACVCVTQCECRKAVAG
jgi:hypothetical protein